MTLTVPVVRTKIIIPRRRTEILSRPRLLSILDNILDLKLVIVAAPAGYGKTSLLIDYAYHSQLPCCWFAIDDLDCDPQRFIAHFIAAIANSFPAFGEASRAALSNLDQDSLNLEPVVSAIINDVYDNITEHFVFVLDDFHLVRDCRPIDGFINRLALEMSENCHFVIASRTLLTLPDLTLLVARSQVGGLSYEELAFLPEEIKQLFSVNYHQNISEKEASNLVSQTEGWITGLLLTAQLSPKETTNRLRLARVSGVGLYDFLAKQVLEQQSDELKLFLKRTSLLEEFDANLCRRIFSRVQGIGDQDWQDLIDEVLRENLFVLPVDDETLHLRFHHLFRDFLQTCMRSERPEETLLIESQLVDYYEESREWELAFSICSRIGDQEKIIGIIHRAAPSMILGSRLLTLSAWLEVIPEAVRKTRPELLSIKGAILMLRGDYGTSLNLLNEAIEGFATRSDTIELARTLIRRSSLHRLTGSYENEKADAEEAVKICRSSKGMDNLEAEALRAVGLAFYHSGDIRNALVSLLLSLEKYNQLGEEMDAAKVLLDIGLVYMALGQLDEADEAYQKSLVYWQESQNSLWQANLLNNLGMTRHMRGQFEEAAISFERAIAHARLALNPRLEGYALTSLGDLYRDIRALPEARKAYQLARQASKSVDDQALSVYLSLSESSLERLCGNHPEAETLIDQAIQIAERGGSRYEINLCKLEYCVFKLTQRKFNGLAAKFVELIDYFAQEGFHLEEIRSRYQLGISMLMTERTNEPENDLISLITTHTDHWDRPSVMVFGFETLFLLDEYSRSKTQKTELDTFFAELHLFEENLIPIRKTIRRRSEIVQFSSPKMVIRAFGKAQVKIGDHAVILSEWKTQMVRDLFFFILLHPDGVTKEEIGEAFWPDSTIDTLRVRFKNSIYRLRHALGSESISFIDEYYRFNRILDYDYDVESFTQELVNAQNTTSDEDRINHLRQAIVHYRGAYLPSIDYDWAIIQREQYHRNFLTAITELIDLLLKTQQYQAVLHYVDRAIAEDPSYEEAYRSAMIAYSALGDRPAISRTYEKCRVNLQKELDLEPANQTNELYQRLIQ